MKMPQIYTMNEDVHDKVDQLVRRYQKGNGLAEKMDETEEGDVKYQVWDSAVFDAYCAAKDLYMEGEKNLDKCIDLLIDWLERCKGKEKELKKAAEEKDGGTEKWGEFQMEAEKAGDY